MQLRAWQAAALGQIEAYLAEPPTGRGRVVCAVMGAGKSILQAEVIRRHLPDPPGVVVVVAPKRRLVDQLEATFAGAMPGKIGVFDGRRKQLDTAVIVTTDHSLLRLARALPPRSCTLLIIDECHRSESPRCLAGASALAPRHVLGFSATPWRASLGERLSLFESVIYSYGVADALRDGVLVPPRLHLWTEADRDRTGLTDVDDVTHHWLTDAPKPCLVSAHSIGDADRFAADLRDRGYDAQAVHSRVSEAQQAAILEQPPEVIVHVNLLSEGVDVPSLRSLILRRRVTSSIRYPQEVGRVLRLAPGKTHADVYDPHAASVSLRLDRDAALWSPREAAVLLPPDPAHRAALDRWIEGRHFTGLFPADNIEGIAALGRSLVVVYSIDELPPGAVDRWRYAAGGPVGVLSVVPPHPDRFALWVGGAEWLDAYRHWLTATRRDEWAPPITQDPTEQLEALGIGGGALEVLLGLEPPPTVAVVTWRVSLLPQLTQALLTRAEQRIIELHPEPVRRVAETLTPTAALLHRGALTADLMGLCRRDTLSESAQRAVMTAGQVERLTQAVREIGAWGKQLDPDDRELMRAAAREGLLGRLTRGEASDLIALLEACNTLGVWVL